MLHEQKKNNLNWQLENIETIIHINHKKCAIALKALIQFVIDPSNWIKLSRPQQKTIESTACFRKHELNRLQWL